MAIRNVLFAALTLVGYDRSEWGSANLEALIVLLLLTILVLGAVMISTHPSWPRHP